MSCRLDLQSCKLVRHSGQTGRCCPDSRFYYYAKLTCVCRKSRNKQFMVKYVDDYQYRGETYYDTRYLYDNDDVEKLVCIDEVYECRWDCRNEQLAAA